MSTQAATPAANGVAPPGALHVTRLPIDDAARQLGVSRATVRRRLRSGGLTGAQVATPHGRKWLVEVPLTTLRTQGVPSETAWGVTPPGGAGPAVSTETAPREVELLQAHVDDLRRQLEERAREVQQLHTLLAQANQRLLLGSQVSHLGESGGGQAPVETSGLNQNGAAPVVWERRRWWHRLLWG